MRLNIDYKDIRSDVELAAIVYSAQISIDVLFQQMNIYDDDSYSLNQDLFVCILKIMLENLYKDILAKYADFPYTREMLYINNGRELLNGMQLFFVKDGVVLADVLRGKIWHTGY